MGPLETLKRCSWRDLFKFRNVFYGGAFGIKSPALLSWDVLPEGHDGCGFSLHLLVVRPSHWIWGRHHVEFPIEEIGFGPLFLLCVDSKLWYSGLRLHREYKHQRWE